MFWKEKPGSFESYFRTEHGFLIREFKKARMRECLNYCLSRMQNMRLSRSRQFIVYLNSCMKTLKVIVTFPFSIFPLNFANPVSRYKRWQRFVLREGTSKQGLGTSLSLRDSVRGEEKEVRSNKTAEQKTFQVSSVHRLSKFSHKDLESQAITSYQLPVTSY